MRFDLEHGGKAIANVDRPGVLARPLKNLRRFSRQRLEVDARALVAAVLGPHHREDTELGRVWLPAQDPDDPIVLIGVQAVTFEHSGIDHSCS
jgi:hypothetical protein